MSAVRTTDRPSLHATAWSLYGPAQPAAVAPWATTGAAVSFHGVEHLGAFPDTAAGLAATGRRGAVMWPMPGARITAAELGGKPARIFSRLIESNAAYRRFIVATPGRSGCGVDLWEPLYGFADRQAAEAWAEGMNDFGEAEFAVLTCAGDGGSLQ